MAALNGPELSQKIKSRSKSTKSKLIGVCSNKIFCLGMPLGTKHNLSKSTESLKSGDSVGIRLVQGNKLELYYNDKLFDTFSLPKGYPQKTPMWGVVDVYGSCVEVKADVLVPKPGTFIAIRSCKPYNYFCACLIYIPVPYIAGNFRWCKFSMYMHISYFKYSYSSG